MMDGDVEAAHIPGSHFFKDNPAKQKFFCLSNICGEDSSKISQLWQKFLSLYLVLVVSYLERKQHMDLSVVQCACPTEGVGS